MKAEDGLRVLTYHRVLDANASPAPNPSLLSASPRAFDAQMRHLSRYYRVVSADQVLDAFHTNRPLPRRAVLITFDDAYRDFGEIAWPILRRYGFPAVVFVSTAFPDHPEKRFWWDRIHGALMNTTRMAVDVPRLGILSLRNPAARANALRALQRHIKSLSHRAAMDAVDALCGELDYQGRLAAQVLGWDELRRLAGEGVTLCAHTRNHPALTRITLDQARAEVRGSREDLQRELGYSPPIFAYPFGDHDDDVIKVVQQEGFDLAVSCLDGHNRMPPLDPFRLCRTNITPKTSGWIFGVRLSRIGARIDTWRHRPPQIPPPVAANTSERQPSETPERYSPAPMKIAYIMSRFPKLTETFVIQEIVTMDTLGIPIEIFPLLRERQHIVHPEAEAWARRANFYPFLSLAILRAHAHFAWYNFTGYLQLCVEVFRKTWGSANFFIGAVGIFPKAVRFAYDMRARGVTHVHAHFATHPALAGLIVNRLTGIPFSFTAHGSDLHVERRMLDTKVQAATFAVTVSSFNREVMIAECGEQMRDKVHVIHCGVDPTLFVPRAARGAQHPFHILCVASFEEVKGHRYLLEACRLLRDRGVDFKCHLVGEGPLRLEVQAAIARCGLEQRVRIHGAMSRPQVIQMLAETDVAALASHPTLQGKREGIPVALMEAMACGLPVVSTAISGIPELVDSGNNGLLVPSGNSLALANALQQLGEDAELRGRMGRAARQKILREFNSATTTRELLALIVSYHHATTADSPELVRSAGYAASQTAWS